jgi:hypothetical protein
MMMTTAESFDWHVEVADAELIGEAARAEGASPGMAQVIENNVLQNPGLLAILRAEPFALDDARIAQVMMDPAGFVDEFCDDMGD